MQFSVDGWDPSYGSSQQELEDAPELVASLDTGVEVDPRRWQPVPLSQVVVPQTIRFVDGVRRSEARLWLSTENDDGRGAVGLCASYAAGVVASTTSQAVIEIAEMKRALVTTAEDATDIATGVGSWQVSVAKPDPGKPIFDLLTAALQVKLTELEIACAHHVRTATGDQDDLLVIDGPLHGREKLPRAIGMIKSHQSNYLQPELNRVVGQLGAGQRTPVFALETTWRRWSWYLRLPGPEGSPWAGVVRIEASPELDLDQVVALADVSQSVLPRYASETFREPRAPQNLYPISGLERQLRHRLGDPGLLRRALMSGRAVSQGSAELPSD